MIAYFEDDGRIYNVLNDPLPNGMIQHLIDANIQHVVVTGDYSASQLFDECYVAARGDGIYQLQQRPCIDGALNFDGLAFSIGPVPTGTGAILIVDPDTEFAASFELIEVGGAISVTLDEPCACKLRVSAPWPYREVEYDIDQQNFIREG